jgi:hypothetical protein
MDTKNALDSSPTDVRHINLYEKYLEGFEQTFTFTSGKLLMKLISSKLKFKWRNSTGIRSV